MLAVDRDGLRLLLSTDDRTLARRLFVYHTTPERDIQRAFTALRAIPGMARRLDGATVLEVGANIGSHTVELLAHYGAGAVIAIEPHPDNCRLLRHNALANGLAERVTVLELALSDRDGLVELELSGSNSGDHRVRVPDGSDSGAEARRPTIEVRSVRLDSLMKEARIAPSEIGLVWMDAQGHEAHILRGAPQLLGSATPILIEYWPYGLRRAGGLDALHDLIMRSYSHVIDVSPPDGAPPRVLPSDLLPRLETEYGWSSAPDQSELGTDLVLTSEIDGDLDFAGGDGADPPPPTFPWLASTHWKAAG